MIRVFVPHELLAESFDQLRMCGDGCRECIVYWTSAIDESDRVTEVVHPQHTASTVGYEVDSAWVNAFFLDLRRRRRTVRVQVHTHPGPASHSEIDDDFALAPATGFISLVLPDFATGAPGLAESHVVVMTPDGAWQAMPPADLVAVEH